MFKTGGSRLAPNLCVLDYKSHHSQSAQGRLAFGNAIEKFNGLLVAAAQQMNRDWSSQELQGYCVPYYSWLHACPHRGAFAQHQKLALFLQGRKEQKDFAIKAAQVFVLYHAHLKAVIGAIRKIQSSAQ